ncbi:MAG: MFS transporter, partial [Clostridia bacterium]
AIMVYLYVPDQVPAPVEAADLTRTEQDRYLEMMRNDTVRGILAIRSSVAMGRGIFSALLPIFAQTIIGLSSAQIGLVVAVRPLLSSVLQPGFGRVADRHNRKWLAVGGFLLAPLAFFLVPWTSNLTQLLLLACLLGLSTGISVPAATSIAVDRGREYGMGRIMGMEGMCQSFAMAIGSTMGGAFVDQFGYSNAFRVAGVIGFSGVGLSLHFLRNYRDTHLTPRPAAENDD